LKGKSRAEREQRAAGEKKGKKSGDDELMFDGSWEEKIEDEPFSKKRAATSVPPDRISSSGTAAK
jgi:hypothetical protein